MNKQIIRGRQSGATLMEVLIALLVFSVGLQGIASLQFQAVKDNFDSVQRSVGVWAAQDLLNRMRANRTGLINDNYDYDGNPCAPGEVPAQLCVDAVCDAEQMAAFDIWDALCRTSDQAQAEDESQLLNLNLNISCADAIPGDGIDCSTGSDFTFDMQWNSKAVTDDTDDTDALLTQQVRQVFRP